MKQLLTLLFFISFTASAQSLIGSGANQISTNGMLGTMAFEDRDQVLNVGMNLSYSSTVTLEMNRADIFYLEATGNFTLNITHPKEFKSISLVVKNTTLSNLTMTSPTAYKYPDSVFVVEPGKINVYTFMRVGGQFILAAMDGLEN